MFRDRFKGRCHTSRRSCHFRDINAVSCELLIVRKALPTASFDVFWCSWHHASNFSFGSKIFRVPSTTLPCVPPLAHRLVQSNTLMISFLYFQTIRGHFEGKSIFFGFWRSFVTFFWLGRGFEVFFSVLILFHLSNLFFLTCQDVHCHFLLESGRLRGLNSLWFKNIPGTNLVQKRDKIYILFSLELFGFSFNQFLLSLRYQMRRSVSSKNWPLIKKVRQVFEGIFTWSSQRQNWCL